MANSFDAMKPTYWSKRMQANLMTKHFFRKICSFEEQSNLHQGKQVNRPYGTHATVGSATFGTGTYSVTDQTFTNESLTVDKWNYVAEHMTKDQRIQLQNAPSIVNDRIDKAAYRLGVEIERTVAAEYANASYSTTATLYTSSTLRAGLTTASKTLRESGVEQDRPWYALVDADTTKLIEDANAGRATVLGDRTVPAGFGFSTEYAGFKVYEANSSLTWTGTITMATNPTEADTVVIDGVTFTFNATPSGAGSVDIGAAAANSVDNLVALINTPGTTTAGGIALSAANQLKFQSFGQTNISATDNTTSITITSKKGRIAMSHTLTASGDGVQDMVLHCPCGRAGNIDLVLQADISTQVRDVSGTIDTKDYVTDVLWGIKTFTEGADRMLDFRVTTAADALTA